MSSVLPFLNLYTKTCSTTYKKSRNFLKNSWLFFGISNIICIFVIQKRK